VADQKKPVLKWNRFLIHQHYPNLALTEKYQAYHIFKGRDVSGSTIIEPPEKDGGRKPGETDKTITSQGGRLSPKLSELGLDYKISSLSQKIAYIHTRTFLHPPYFEYLRGCFKAIFKKRLILYNFKLS